MTKDLRPPAPDERAATHSQATPLPHALYTGSTIPAPTPPSHNSRNMDTPTSKPPLIQNTTLLDPLGTCQDSKEPNVNQYSPSVPSTQRRPQRTKHSQSKLLNHHTHAAHSHDRKRKRKASDSPSSQDPTLAIIPPTTTIHPCFPTPHVPNKTKVAQPQLHVPSTQDHLIHTITTFCKHIHTRTSTPRNQHKPPNNTYQPKST